MSVSKNDVVMAYRLMLGREPESEAVVLGHMKCENVQMLRARFLQSAEFLRKNQKKIRKPFLVPLDPPSMEVETDASGGELAAMAAKIKTAWDHLGSVRAHYSVLTNPQYLPENLGESIDEFWRSGDVEAAMTQRILERHAFTSLQDKTCVEYGCGVGRVSMGLARRFACVHSYDISPSHLAYAEQRAQELGLKNLVFHQCSENILEGLKKCDFFYSRIVFQHNPPPVIAHLIKNALRSLSPGGIAIFQVPTYAIGYRFKTDEWLNTEHALDMQMHCLPQGKIFSVVSAEGCLLLEVREDNSTGASESVSNTFVIRKSIQPPVKRLLRYFLRAR